MDNELRERIEKLAAVECNIHSGGDECGEKGCTGRRWYPLDNWAEQIGSITGEIILLYAIEQCLSMAGKYYFHDSSYDTSVRYPYCYRHTKINTLTFPREDRLTAVVECLEAINAST